MKKLGISRNSNFTFAEKAEVLLDTRSVTRSSLAEPMVIVLLLSLTVVLVRAPSIEAQTQTNNPIFNENFENGWNSWTDIYTGLTPVYSLSTNESHSPSHSAWGGYTPNKLLVSRTFGPTSGDVRVEAWLFMKSGGYNVDAGFKLYYNSSMLASFCASDYASSTYEVDKWSGYNSTLANGSFYDSWTNVTMLLQFSLGTIKVWINNTLTWNLDNSNSPCSSINEIRIFSDDGNIGSYIDDISLSQNLNTSPTPTPSPTSAPTSTPSPSPTLTPLPSTETPSPSIEPSSAPTPTDPPTTTANPVQAPEMPNQLVFTYLILAILSVSLLVLRKKKIPFSV